MRVRPLPGLMRQLARRLAAPPRPRKSSGRGWSVDPLEVRVLPAASATLEMPDYLETVVETDFGTEITRVSDHTAMGVDLTDQRFIRNAYSKVQPWNADESLLLLGYDWPGTLLDGQTGKFIRTVWQPNQARWSNRDPNILFGVMGNKLVKQDYSNIRDLSSPLPEFQTIREFTEFDSISIGDGEGNFSDNDRLVVLQCRKGTNTYLVLYNQYTNDMQVMNTNGAWPDNCTISPSGKFVIVQWMTSGRGRMQGTEVYQSNGTSLVFRRQLTEWKTHFDVGYDVGRAEVIVFRDPAVWANGIVKVRVDTGRMTRIYWGTGNNQPSWSGSHVSFQNSKRPGWVYWSDYAPSNQSDRLGYRQIYAIKLDGSRTVEKFAYARVGDDRTVYGVQPMAVPNRDGTRVLFASSWNGAAGDPVYTYIVRKPKPLTTTRATRG